MSTLWPDTVKRGPMVREVRGLGTLVPVDTMVIPATTDGRVERILVYPGTPVKADTVAMTLTSPELGLANSPRMELDGPPAEFFEGPECRGLQGDCPACAASAFGVPE